jgi:uncharacterized protein YndB with AHSA1/START domain
VGGKIRIEMTHLDGDVFAFQGHFAEIDKPNLLSFTMKWDQSSVEHAETLVTVSFQEHEGKTRMTLTHTKLSSDESITEHTKGWTGCVDSLETYINNL